MKTVYRSTKRRWVAHKKTTGYWHTATANCLVHLGQATSAWVCTWMGDLISMLISVESPSDETLKTLQFDR